MAFVRDPYRVLGLARGASLDEVKRAYRRLAKEHHPDSAGERALPRFLEIQAAYEQLVGPSGGGRGRGSTTTGRPRPAWQAEDTRADATHRAYGARSRGSATRGARPAGRAGPAGGPGRPAREEPDGGTGDRPRGRQRPPNKATPGSTTYDGADDQPFEPGWTGASWYGTSSGTYWTLNPREYADPRKHGPEYQARARRAREDARREDEADGAASAGEPAADAAGSDPAEPAGDTRPSSTWWTAEGRGARTTAETEAAPNDPPGGAPPPPRFDSSSATDAPPPDPFALLGALERVLIDDPRRSPGARLSYAVVGGIPVVLALAWVVGELTGCGRFAATCEPAAISAAWIGGVAVVGLLLLAPWLGSVASVGTVALVLAAIPATIFLSATGGSRQPEASSVALGAVLAVAWAAGVAFALGRRRRASARRGPVS